MMDNYNFFKMGYRCASEGVDNLDILAEKIRTLYGSDASLEFQAGCVSSMDPYEEIKEFYEFELGSNLKGSKI